MVVAVVAVATQRELLAGQAETAAVEQEYLRKYSLLMGYVIQAAVAAETIILLHTMAQMVAQE